MENTLLQIFSVQYRTVFSVLSTTQASYDRCWQQIFFSVRERFIDVESNQVLTFSSMASQGKDREREDEGRAAWKMCGEENKGGKEETKHYTTKLLIYSIYYIYIIYIYIYIYILYNTIQYNTIYIYIYCKCTKQTKLRFLHSAVFSVLVGLKYIK